MKLEDAEKKFLKYMFVLFYGVKVERAGSATGQLVQLRRRPVDGPREQRAIQAQGVTVKVGDTPHQIRCKRTRRGSGRYCQWGRGRATQI